MKQTLFRQILILSLIGLLLVLVCHGHYHSPWEGNDGQCVFCQLLLTGFTDCMVFYLLVGSVGLLPGLTVESYHRFEPYFGRRFRGPPLYPLC